MKDKQEETEEDPAWSPLFWIPCGRQHYLFSCASSGFDVQNDGGRFNWMCDGEWEPSQEGERGKREKSP